MFPSSTHILVVDDMGAMRLRIVNQLKKMGYENISQAENGQEAFDLVAKAKTDMTPIELVLSDWNMPVLSGLEFLKKLRGTFQYKDLPFLMVTAEGEKDQVLEAIKSGVSDYVIKPVSPDDLKGKLQNVFAKHNKEKAG